MIHVILMILKIIGIILLCILGLLLFIFLSVLFVPARYRVSASYYGKPKAVARATWFLHLLSVSMVFENNKVRYKFKIAGFSLKDSEKDSQESDFRKDDKKNKHEKKQQKTKDKPAKKTEGVSQIRDLAQSDEQKSLLPAEKQKELLKKEHEQGNSESKHELAKNMPNDSEQRTLKKTQEPEVLCNKIRDNTKTTNIELKKKNLQEPKEHAQPQRHRRKKKQLESVWNRIKQFLKKCFDKIRGFYQKIMQFLRSALQKLSDTKVSLQEKYEKVVTFINDEENHILYGFLKEQIVLVIKHIRPSKYRIYARIGSEEPDILGKILALSAIVTSVLNIKAEIEPAFGETIFEGEIFAKGRVRVITVGRIALKIYRNKQLKKLMKR